MIFEQDIQRRRKVLKEKESYGYFGVRKIPVKKWKAQRKIDGKKYCGESRNTIEEAARDSE